MEIMQETNEGRQMKAGTAKSRPEWRSQREGRLGGSGRDFGDQQPNLWEVRTPIASSYLGKKKSAVNKQNLQNIPPSKSRSNLRNPSALFPEVSLRRLRPASPASPPASPEISCLLKDRRPLTTFTWVE